MATQGLSGSNIFFRCNTHSTIKIHNLIFFTSFTIAPITADVSTTPASSNSASDGTATVWVTPANIACNFLWDTGSVAVTVTGLTVDVHYVTVTAQNGCPVNPRRVPFTISGINLNVG